MSGGRLMDGPGADAYTSGKERWNEELRIVHEVGIMLEALEIAAAQARKSNAQRIHRIQLRIGSLSGVVPEALRFAFDALAPDSPAAGATLDIEVVPVTVRCAGCDATFTPSSAFYECPHCHEPSCEVRAGREIEVSSLEVS